MPRKTTKKPTTKKVAAKKTAVKKATPKRKAYQTGGTAKSQMPRSQALAREQARALEEARLTQEQERVRQATIGAESFEQARLDRDAAARQIIERERNAVPPNPMESQYADRINETMQRYRREQGLMELGNRQRAAAARARAQRPVQGLSRAQAARNMAEYERAMAARQANLSRGSTPARPRVPTAQQRAEYQRMVSNINRSRANAVPATPRQQPRPQMRTPTPQELARLRANPNRPSMTNQVRNQGNASERRRLQQQIAQLQARLRQLGG